MHKYRIVYLDENDVRHKQEIEIKDAKHIKGGIIGIQRYTKFDAGKVGGWEQNGTFPILTTETFDNLYGKLLTICDASFSEDKQREAFKSLIKDATSSWFRKNIEYTFKTSEQFDVEEYDDRKPQTVKVELPE